MYVEGTAEKQYFFILKQSPFKNTLYSNYKSTLESIFMQGFLVHITIYIVCILRTSYIWYRYNSYIFSLLISQIHRLIVSAKISIDLCWYYSYIVHTATVYYYSNKAIIIVYINCFPSLPASILKNCIKIDYLFKSHIATLAGLV